MAELLVVPYKKSSDVDLVKPLQNVVAASGADSSPELGEALAELARLRNDAVWKVFEHGSLDVLHSYHDQLAWLESKVPPQEVQVPFKWKDAFDRGSIFGGRMSLTVSSLAFERVCVLFNIAAGSSAAAAREPLDTEESLKAAARLLQQAAGVFQALRGRVPAAVHRDPTPDLAPDTLDALAKLMLAQAQELVAYKCIRDEMKDAMVAKVCAAGEEMYAEAARAMQKETQRALWEREWLPTVAAKQQALRGLAQLFQAGVARAAGAVGEEIARLTLACDALRPAAARLEGAARLRELASRAARRLAAAVKDNDFIYHERVPEEAALEAVARAPVAKPLPVPERFTAARDPFAALVPIAVRGALAASDARRADLVAAEIARLRDATQLLNGALASLNLPARLEERPAGALPASIAEKAAAVRAAGGAAALRRLMDELPELLQRNRDILNEAERALREEEEADASLREQFGARWTRTESRKLTEGFRANGDKYRQIIDNAVRADGIVRDKFKAHERDIERLGGPEAALLAAVPAGAGAPPPGAALDELRALMREVDALKAERDAIEAELKDATVDLRATFLSALAESGAVDEPALSAGALGAALAPLRARVESSLAAQEALLARVRAAAAADAPPARAGDDALAALAAAHDAYQELTGNLTEGTKFYNDLTQLLVAYQSKVEDFCFARKTEKEELLKDLTQAASRAAPPPPSGPAMPEQAASKKEAPPRPPPPQAAGSGPQGALPYPTQGGAMPQPYGGVAAPYPYYAPMPAMYNPYATLPYPHHARMPPPQPYAPYQHPAPPYQQPAPPPGYNPYPQPPQ